MTRLLYRGLRALALRSRASLCLAGFAVALTGLGAFSDSGSGAALTTLPLQGLSCSAGDGAGWCWQRPQPAAFDVQDIFFLDNQRGGLCMDMLAEACAPGIRPHISTPANHRYPWSGVPGQLRSTLQAKQPRGGPVERVFTGAEDLIDAFRRQTRPLLSVQLFPIHFGDAWWGYVGFDDCQAPREWDEQEITLLRTASEVMGSALQRWEAEAQARQARDELEHRFEERTRELRQRLETETALAAISSQLLTEADFEQAVQRALASVGQMLSASAVILMRAARDSGASRAAAPALRRVHGWRDPRAGGLSPAQAALFEDPGQWLGSPLVWSGAAIDFADAVHLPPELPTGREGTPPDGGIPLIVVPLAVEQRVFGALACASAARRSRRTWRPCR